MSSATRASPFGINNKCVSQTHARSNLVCSKRGSKVRKKRKDFLRNLAKSPFASIYACLASFAPILRQKKEFRVTSTKIEYPFENLLFLFVFYFGYLRWSLTLTYTIIIIFRCLIKTIPHNIFHKIRVFIPIQDI